MENIAVIFNVELILVGEQFYIAIGRLILYC